MLTVTRSNSPYQYHRKHKDDSVENIPTNKPTKLTLVMRLAFFLTCKVILVAETTSIVELWTRIAVFTVVPALFKLGIFFISLCLPYLVTHLGCYTKKMWASINMIIHYKYREVWRQKTTFVTLSDWLAYSERTRWIQPPGQKSAC